MLEKIRSFMMNCTVFWLLLFVGLVLIPTFQNILKKSCVYRVLNLLHR